jgi:deoxycytidylate deaminase
MTAYRFTPKEIDAILEEAQRVATQAGTCTRANVGAVLINHYGQFQAYGVNQDTEGARRCDQGFCARGTKTYEELPPDAPYTDCIYTHAEMVAVGIALDAPQPAYWSPGALADWSIFVTHKPCHECAPALDKLGVVVYYHEDPVGLLAL